MSTTNKGKKIEVAKQKLKKILIYDLEATCWEDREKTKNEGEIIEIGVVPLDLRDMELRHDLGRSWLIKPKRTEISKYCTELTGITQDEINENALPFNEVMNSIRKAYSKDHPCSGWGWYDYWKLNSACSENNIDFPFNRVYQDLKMLYALLTGRTKPAGLKEAISEQGLKFLGDQHRALNDAMNTGDLICHTLKKAKRNFI